MKPLVALAHVVVMVSLFAPEASAQCATWAHLGQIGYAQGATCIARGPGPLGVVIGGWNSDSPHESAMSPGISDGVSALSSPIGWIFGEVRGVAYFDLGSGPVLHAWGTMTAGFPAVTPAFHKIVSGFTAVHATSTVLPGAFLAVTVFDSGAGVQYHAATANAVWRWNGASWVSLGATIGTVTQLVVHDDGSGAALYAAGNISSIGGVPVPGVARWNGNNWSAVPGLTGGDVTSLVSVPDANGRTLVAGGSFTHANGSQANGVARWDGAVWSGFGAGLPFTVVHVAGIDAFDRGTGEGLEIAVSARGAAASERTIASWNGTSWTVLSALPGTTPPGGMAIIAVDASNTPGRDLFALLDVIWSPPSSLHSPSWVQFEACGLTGALSCFGDGAQIACPCGNQSATGDRAGCLNSTGVGATLRARGRTSLSADTAQLDGGAMPDGPLLYYQGTAFGPSFTIGDGINCVGGQLIRLGIRFNSGQASTFPGAGSPSLSTTGFVAAPGARHYQARYRDAGSFCTSATFSYTNAVTLVWEP